MSASPCPAQTAGLVPGPSALVRRRPSPRVRLHPWSARPATDAGHRDHDWRMTMADYKYEFVKVRIQDGIAWAALNRPDKRNAMSPALHYEMDDALARLEVDDDAKVVVVTGEGGNFSAGQDLKLFFRELERNPGER